MSTYADKTQENKSRSLANAVSQKQSGGEATFQFEDNRLEAIAQRKLQEMDINSLQVRQVSAFQGMANYSLKAKQATQLQAMADKYTTQQQPNENKILNSTSNNAIQLSPMDWQNAPQINRLLGHPHGWFSTWKKIKAKINEYRILQPANLDARRAKLNEIELLIIEWKNKPKHTAASNVQRVQDILADMPVLELLVNREYREMPRGLTGKMGVFEAVGEGNMTTYNMATSGYRVPNSNPNAANLNAQIDVWTGQRGFGLTDDGNQAPTLLANQDLTALANQDLTALNQIFNMNTPQDALSHADALMRAYLRLARSQTDVGIQLAATLAHTGSYTITLNDNHGKGHQKPVTLKLIIQPGIPGQFLSPFEQGMTIDNCIGSPTPLPAVIMWDPILHFEYYRPRTIADASKAENDSTRRGDLESMEPWVVLSHELGHFTDFLNRPNDFANNLQRDGGIDEIEEWNLPREQALVRGDLDKTPRSYYQDFPRGHNEPRINR